MISRSIPTPHPAATCSSPDCSALTYADGLCRLHARHAAQARAYARQLARDRERRAAKRTPKAAPPPPPAEPPEPRDYGHAIGYVCAASTGPCRIDDCRHHLIGDGCAIRVANGHTEPTLEQVADWLGPESTHGERMSRERIRQIETAAIAKIRRATRLPIFTAADELRAFHTD